MKPLIGRRSRSLAPALRELLTVLLTAAYIVVGFGGEISCAQETLEAVQLVAQSDLGDVQGKADEGTKKPVVAVVDHCYTCVPLLIPAPVLIAEPAAKSVAPAYATPTFFLEDHPRLDTPPPKYRT